MVVLTRRSLVALVMLVVLCCLETSATPNKLQVNKNKKLLRVKRDPSFSDAEPGLDRVKRSKRHTLEDALRLVQEKKALSKPGRRLIRVKRDEPELQRFKRGSMEEVALHRFKRGDDLADALQRVKRGGDLEAQLARVKRQNVDTAKEVDLHRFKRARRSAEQVPEKKSTGGHKNAAKKSMAQKQLHSNEISERHMSKDTDEGHEDNEKAQKHALKENREIKLGNHDHQKGKNHMKKNKTELHRSADHRKTKHDVKKPRKKNNKRARSDKKNKKHSKKSTLSKSHLKHKKSADIKLKGTGNVNRKERLVKATAALAHRQLLQKQVHKNSKRAHRSPTMKQRKSRLLKKARMHAIRAQNRRKRQQLKPVFLHNVKKAPTMHRKREGKRQKWV